MDRSDWVFWSLELRKLETDWIQRQPTCPRNKTFRIQNFQVVLFLLTAAERFLPVCQLLYCSQWSLFLRPFSGLSTASSLQGKQTKQTKQQPGIEFGPRSNVSTFVLPGIQLLGRNTMTMNWKTFFCASVLALDSQICVLPRISGTSHCCLSKLEVFGPNVQIERNAYPQYDHKEFHGYHRVNSFLTVKICDRRHGASGASAKWQASWILQLKSQL